MSLIGALNALKAGQAAKKTAPFYSAVDEALAAIKRPKGTGAEFFTELSKQAGVKKAELADRKLEQAFKAKGKITKEEAQQVLKDNPPAKLSEKVLDERDFKDYDEIVEELAQEKHRAGIRDITGSQRRDIYEEADQIFATQRAPKYQDYRLPSGKNYREILLKLPVQGEDVTKLNEISMALHGVPYTSLMGDKSELAKMRLAVKREYKNVYGESGRIAEDRGIYQSNHWKEDPNVLAHMRVQDRTGPNGEKILHVEEIQSDWHQAGRKKGYQHQGGTLTPEEKARFTDLVLKDLSELTAGEHDELMRLSAKTPLTESEILANKDKVPDAPFKKNWHELAMKRLLNYAADNGYDSIAITPGAEQAKRFSLSKQIDELIYSDDGSLYASKGGKKVFNERVTPEQLPDYVGKEVAEKLVSAQPNEVGSRVIGGLDLEVGGEGMKGFYDQILPSYLNTFGKPYGAQVESIAYPAKKMDWDTSGQIPRQIEVDEQYPLHTFKITPEMRQQIQQKGLPLYQQIGIPTAGAGAASQMPKQMQEPELEPEVKKADGGAINYNTAPDMSDGGRIIQGAPFKRGGKVKVTTNPDAMFMELSNKKLKRK